MKLNSFSDPLLTIERPLYRLRIISQLAIKISFVPFWATIFDGRIFSTVEFIYAESSRFASLTHLVDHLCTRPGNRSAAVSWDIALACPFDSFAVEDFGRAVRPQVSYIGRKKKTTWDWEMKRKTTKINNVETQRERKTTDNFRV